MDNVREWRNVIHLTPNEFPFLLSMELQPFSKKFQSDSSMTRKLCDELNNILNRMLDWCVDTEKKFSMSELTHFDSVNMKSVLDVDIGFGARRQLKKVKEVGVSQLEIIRLRKDCRVPSFYCSR